MKLDPKPLLLNYSDFALGHDEIDKQHRDIIDYINNLYIARFSGDKDKIIEVINSMITPNKAHFSLEESMMKEVNYPQYEEHLAEHNKFLTDNIKYLELYKSGENVLEEFQSFLFQWLLQHIRFSDKQMITYYNKFFVK